MSFVNRSMRAGVTVPTTCAVLVLLTSCAAAGSQNSDAGQEPPEGWRGEPYSVMELSDVPGLPSAERNLLVTYGSQGASGERVTTSGTIAIPPGPPPEEGWPVVSWAHGTTGVSDLCAPSADRPGGPAHDYLAMADETLDDWVDRGYVVVRADYEGLGTPGGHPYLNGTSAAGTVSDLVTAAQRVDAGVGEEWIALGHSQGGHAVLYTADARSDVGPSGSPPLGVISVAPGGVDVSQLVTYFEHADPDDERVVEALPFLPIMLLGAAAADPEIVPEELVSEDVEPVLEAARTGCMADVQEATQEISLDTVFREDVRTEDLEEYLRGQEPDTVELEVPTLFIQGTEDVLVPAEDTERLAQVLSDKAASDVEYRAYEGEDHRGVLASSFDDVVDFADRLFEERDS